jgi:hypothetical protein
MRISLRTAPRLPRLFHSPGTIPFPCPHSSVILQCRNLHLLSIDYVSPPRLRPRLPQGRSALPWIPWIFGRKDSHLTLATHSGILSSQRSTAPYGTASSRVGNAPLPMYTLLMIPELRCRVSAPVHFRRRTSRLVSYYALFECMAASEPTS